MAAPTARRSIASRVPARPTCVRVAQPSLSACAQDAKLAAKWDGGASIKNKDVRKALAVAQFPESESTLRELYADFSNGAHPNRDLVAERHLGTGNEFTLGSIGVPSLVGIVDQFIHVIEMWFWFGAVVGLAAHYALERVDPTFSADYLAAVSKAGEVKKWLVENFNRLLEESHADPDNTTSSPPAV